MQQDQPNKCMGAPDTHRSQQPSRGGKKKTKTKKLVEKTAQARNMIIVQFQVKFVLTWNFLLLSNQYPSQTILQVNFSL